MSNKSKNAMGERKGEQRPLVPSLRFPEFVGQRLRKVLFKDVTAESTKRNGDNHSAMPVMGVSKAEGIVPMEERLIASDIARYKIVQKDWFAYNPMRLNIGSIAQWKGEHNILVSPDYVVFKCLDGADSGVDPSYLNLFRQSDAWERFVTEGGDGGVRVRIYYRDLARLQLALPWRDEQQKIADCLTSLDDLIKAETRKLDTLKAHKAGLMQQLFPREGETVPRLRFPEFQDAGEWVTVPMGSLLARNPEYGLNAPASPYSVDLPTYLRITDIDDDGRFLSESKVSVDVVATDDNYLELGDIVLARTGASVGKSYRYREEDGRLVFAGFLIRIRPNPKKVIPIFLSNFLTTQQYWSWIGVTSARSGQPGVNGTEYASLPVPVPSSETSEIGLSEQQRIADCLSSLDDLIAAQSKKINALKIHKKGLMQQLFPVLDEVAI